MTSYTRGVEMIKAQITFQQPHVWPVGNVRVEVKS